MLEYVTAPWDVWWTLWIYVYIYCTHDNLRNCLSRLKHCVYFLIINLVTVLMKPSTFPWFNFLFCVFFFCFVTLIVSFESCQTELRLQHSQLIHCFKFNYTLIQLQAYRSIYCIYHKWTFFPEKKHTHKTKQNKWKSIQTWTVETLAFEALWKNWPAIWQIV